MSTTNELAQAESQEVDVIALSKALTKKDNRLKEFEQRLTRLEKRIKNNERFAHTFVDCVSTQVTAIDAINAVLCRGLRDNTDIQEELMLAIKTYDQHKIRRFFSGLFGVIMWVASVMVAAVVGAFIYWVFSGQ